MPNFLGNFFSRLVAGAEQVPSRKDTPQTAGSLRSEYKFGATLGQGAFGLVREATLLRTGEKFAVKTVNKSLLLKKERERLAYKAKQAKLREKGNAGNSASQRKEEPKNESALSIVEREISILKMSGGHPNLIELVDFIETKDDYYLFFPLCSGGELFSRIASAGRFNERDAAVVMATVSNAVAFLHAKGIIHRDIKPENLLFRDQSPDSSLVLVDFGISTSIESEDQLLQSYCGSPGYAAPEIIQKLGYSYPADVWSLGVLSHLLLTGASPFPASQPILEVYDRIVRGNFVIPSRHISDLAKSFILALMDPDPNARPEADEILDHPWIRKMVPRSYLEYLRRINVEAMKAPDSNVDGVEVDVEPAAPLSLPQKLPMATADVDTDPRKRQKTDALDVVNNNDRTPTAIELQAPNGKKVSPKDVTAKSSLHSALSAALAESLPPSAAPVSLVPQVEVSKPADTAVKKPTTPPLLNRRPSSAFVATRKSGLTSSLKPDGRSMKSSPVAIPIHRPGSSTTVAASPVPVIPFTSPLGRSIPYPSSFRGMMQLADEAEEEEKQTRFSKTNSAQDLPSNNESSTREEANEDSRLPNLLEQENARDRYMSMTKAGSLATSVPGFLASASKRVSSPQNRFGGLLSSSPLASSFGRLKVAATDVLSSSPMSDMDSGPTSDIEDDKRVRQQMRYKHALNVGLADRNSGHTPSPPSATFGNRSPLSMTDPLFDSYDDVGEGGAPFGMNMDDMVALEPLAGDGEIKIAPSAGRTRALSISQASQLTDLENKFSAVSMGDEFGSGAGELGQSEERK